MATLVSSPSRPIPGMRLKITFSGLNGDTNFLRVFAVSAPQGSDVRKQIDTSVQERPRVHDGPSDLAWDFTPDRGGVYRFFLEELKQRPASGAMFQGDPAGAPAPEIVSTSDVVLYVGQRMQLQLGVPPNTAQLRVYVWEDTVYPTTVAVHGEATPAIVSPANLTAANAATDSGVIAALSALRNETASNIIGSPASVYASLRSAYAAHIGNNTVHDAQDNFNVVAAGYSATNTAAAIRAVNELRLRLRGHQDNLIDRSDPDNLPTAPHNYPDGTNFYFTAGASDAASLISALVDAWMVYEAHRVLTGVHNSADNTNVGPALSPLMELHRRFLAAVASQSPAVPPETNEGVSVLAQLAGFVEA